MPTFQFNTNRIMFVLKVETDINTNIEYVKTFKSDIIVFICYVIMCWTKKLIKKSRHFDVCIINKSIGNFGTFRLTSDSVSINKLTDIEKYQSV
jgi:hypothetical protein